MISDKIGFISITIGFALEWIHNIVTHIVIIKNVSESVFMVDNTKQTQVQIQTITPNAIDPTEENEVAVSNSTAQPLSASTPIETDESSVATPTPVITTVDSAPTPTSPSKWYPGKYAKQVRSKSKDTKDDTSKFTEPPASIPNTTPNAPVDVELTWELYFETVLGRSLTPPYLVPRPPPIPPTITVTVHRAVGLVSRMKRVVARPINSYVELTIHDRVRSTPVVRMNANPVYDTTNGLNKFIFEIPSLLGFNSTNGILHVDVKDRHVVAQEDLLACVDIPFASLKTTNTGSGALAELCYPLDMKERNANILPRLHVARKVTHSHIATTPTVAGEGNSNKELDVGPCVFLSVNKVDIMSWWVLEEQRMRDEKRKRDAADEKLRLKAASLGMRLRPGLWRRSSSSSGGVARLWIS